MSYLTKLTLIGVCMAPIISLEVKADRLDPFGQIYIPFNDDQTVKTPSFQNQGTDETRLTRALQSGARIKIEFASDGRVLEYDPPQRLVLKKVPMNVLSTAALELRNLEAAIASSLLAIRVKPSFFAFFTSASEIGKPQALIAIELQLRLPTTVDLKSLPSDIREKQILFDPTGAVFSLKSQICKTLLQKLI